MQSIKITKMNGCGNDFVIVDFEEYQKTEMTMSNFAIRVCDRNFGVGADGLIIPNLAEKDADIGWYFYNSDGSTAQMCGNGMRCFAKYIFDRELLAKKRSFSVKTLRGIIIPEILENGLVKVNMSKPVFELEKIPFKGEKNLNCQVDEYTVSAISMGNPHCVIFTENETYYMAKNFGPDLEKHTMFPEKTNVDFVKVLSRNEIEMTVYERGCGITLACGTGACASVVACILNNLTENRVTAHLPGGDLIVEWQVNKGLEPDDVFLTGPCNYNFFAEFVL